MTTLRYIAIANKPGADKLIYDATGHVCTTTEDTYQALKAIVRQTEGKSLAKIIEKHPDFNMFEAYFKEKFNNESQLNFDDDKTPVKFYPTPVTTSPGPLTKKDTEQSNQLQSDQDRRYMFSTNAILLGSATILSLALLFKNK